MPLGVTYRRGLPYRRYVGDTSALTELVWTYLACGVVVGGSLYALGRSRRHRPVPGTSTSLAVGAALSGLFWPVTLVVAVRHELNHDRPGHRCGCEDVE